MCVVCVMPSLCPARVGSLWLLLSVCVYIWLIVGLWDDNGEWKAVCSCTHSMPLPVTALPSAVALLTDV